MWFRSAQQNYLKNILIRLRLEQLKNKIKVSQN